MIDPNTILQVIGIILVASISSYGTYRLTVRTHSGNVNTATAGEVLSTALSLINSLQNELNRVRGYITELEEKGRPSDQAEINRLKGIVASLEKMLKKAGIEVDYES